MTASFWLNDPTVLFKRENIGQVWPLPQMSSEDKLNAITRLVIILTLLGYLVTNTLKIVITGIVTLAAIIVLYKAQETKTIQEGLDSQEPFTNPKLYEMMKDNFAEPTQQNPAMNVLLPEINDNPNRKAAAPAYNRAVERKMNDATKRFVASTFDDPDIDAKLFKDLGDNFTFDQSMRTWYATPNTQIPNDQHAFAEYCYGDMISCKEGNEFACMQGAPPRWTNN